MRRIWSRRLSPRSSFGHVRNVAAVAAFGTAATIAACQNPEPFIFDGGVVPGTGGIEATGGKMTTTGGRPTTGGMTTTGGRTGGTSPSGGSAGRATGGGGPTGGIVGPTGGIVGPTGGRTGGSIPPVGGMRTGGAGGGMATGGTGGPVPNMCTAQMVQVSAQTGAAASNTLNLKFQILNAGNEDLKLSTLKIRYYFKFATTSMPKLVYEVDNTTVAGGKAIVAATTAATTPVPAATGADQYLEISFAATGSGVVTPANSFIMEGRLHDPAYVAMFSPPGDYSYVAATTGYVKNMKVVATITAAPAAPCIAWGTPPM